MQNGQKFTLPVNEFRHRNHVEKQFILMLQTVLFNLQSAAVLITLVKQILVVLFRQIISYYPPKPFIIFKINKILTIVSPLSDRIFWQDAVRHRLIANGTQPATD